MYKDLWRLFSDLHLSRENKTSKISNFKEHKQINLIFWRCSLCFLLSNRSGWLSEFHKGALWGEGNVMVRSGASPGGHRTLDHWARQHCGLRTGPLDTFPSKRAPRTETHVFPRGSQNSNPLKYFSENLSKSQQVWGVFCPRFSLRPCPFTRQLGKLKAVTILTIRKPSGLCLAQRILSLPYHRALFFFFLT